MHSDLLYYVAMNTIHCPHCHKLIEIDEILEHELREKIETDQKKKFEQSLSDVKLKMEKDAQKKAEKEFELSVKSAQEEVKENKIRIEKLIEELTLLTKQNRLLAQQKEESKLELEKKLSKEIEKIQEETQKRVQDQQQLKIAEYEKKIADATKANEELQRKLQQGSQQTQGEVLELALEQLLKKEFPNDDIKPVPKGVRGADVIQEVKDKYGRVCGTILWESKNAKWTDEWIDKLKEDQRTCKADVSILVSIELPKKIHTFGYHGGVWITDRLSIVGLTTALRISLWQVFSIKQSQTGKDEKKEILYSYFTGIEFRQRVEGIIEAFSSMQEDIEREKRWFSSKWARQEKAIRKALDSTHGMHGELQNILGIEQLPQLKGLQEE
jgi:hypothetical protein